MKNKALIIVAHGSRKASSNEEVIALGEKVRVLKDTQYAYVTTSFLEFASPSLKESILMCIEKGMDEIVILPYFLAGGHHVTRDIPEILNAIQASHTHVKIILKEHLGSSPGMARLLNEMSE